MKNIKIILLIFLITFLCAVINKEIVHHKSEISTKTKTIRIGAILSLSGDFAYVGRAFQAGIELAKSELGNIEIDYQDDQSLVPMEVIRGLQKILFSHKPEAVLLMSIDNLAAIEPILKQHNVPALTIWDSSEKMETSPQTFLSGYSTEYVGITVSDFAIDRLKLKKIAVISANGEWAERVSTAFVENAKNRGLEIIMHSRIDAGERDLRAIILRAIREGSQGLFIPTYFVSLSALIRQARELGFRGEIMTGDGLLPEYIKSLGSFVEGIYMMSSWTENQEFKQKYESTYGQIQDEVKLGLTALGYDALQLVVKAQQLEGSNVERLKKISYQGVMGVTSFQNSQISPKKETLVTIKNQKFIKVQ